MFVKMVLITINKELQMCYYITLMFFMESRKYNCYIEECYLSPFIEKKCSEEKKYSFLMVLE